MAEALAVAAAAVQFLDVGARLLLVLSRVCTDLRHVPREIEDTVQELKEFLQLVRLLDSDIRAPNTGPASTLNGALAAAHIDHATSLLSQCIIQAQQLEETLSPLVLKANDHAIRKAWRAVVALKTEKEILRKWDRLQRLKASLCVWYNHTSLLLLKDQA